MLIWNLGLDQFRQERKRFLPPEVASLGWDDIRHAFLHDVQFRSARNLLQSDRRLHFSRQVRVVEGVVVANAFVGFQLDVFAAERVTLARGEICKRHLVTAANFGLHVVNLARESVRW